MTLGRVRNRKSWIAALAWVSSAGGQPLLRVVDAQLSSQPVVIAYGDIRFTNPRETIATDPKVRRWLIDRIVSEKPDAVLLSGDVPWHGGVAADYAAFHAETEPWRAAHILISPALGNHELYGLSQQRCLENWWHEFPELRGRRWYSAGLGSQMLVLNLDSNSPLLPGSAQMQWIKQQLASLKPSVKFVFVNLHHPPVADFQKEADADHNPRPNEIALADFLKHEPLGKRVRFVVTAGHIHNYERFLRDGVLYLVSGGGGAAPRLITRGPDDLYRDASFPNYHYIKFVLRENRLEAEMIRVADPSAANAGWEVKDRFEVAAP